MRTALQQASSVSGLLNTTEAMLAEHAEDEAAPATPVGGMGSLAKAGSIEHKRATVKRYPWQ